jgi:hypothetical protein
MFTKDELEIILDGRSLLPHKRAVEQDVRHPH